MLREQRSVLHKQQVKMFEGKHSLAQSWLLASTVCTWQPGFGRHGVRPLGGIVMTFCGAPAHLSSLHHAAWACYGLVQVDCKFSPIVREG
jgi:hypothetical protein